MISHFLVRYGSNAACWDFWSPHWRSHITHFTHFLFTDVLTARRSMDHLRSQPLNLLRVGYGWRINDHQWKNLLTHLSVRMNSTSTFTSVRICNIFFIKVDDVTAYTFQPQMTSHRTPQLFRTSPNILTCMDWDGMGWEYGKYWHNANGALVVLTA